MVNNCLFIDNVAETTAAGRNAQGGAISAESKFKVFNSIFKKNKAIQVTTSGFGGGGAIEALDDDVLVLSSVFDLNEASDVGGAAQFNDAFSVAWYNNKELLFGNDAGEDCDGVGDIVGDCFNVTDNVSLEF